MKGGGTDLIDVNLATLVIRDWGYPREASIRTFSVPSHFTNGPYNTEVTSVTCEPAYAVRRSASIGSHHRDFEKHWYETLWYKRKRHMPSATETALHHTLNCWQGNPKVHHRQHYSNVFLTFIHLCSTDIFQFSQTLLNIIIQFHAQNIKWPFSRWIPHHNSLYPYFCLSYLSYVPRL